MRGHDRLLPNQTPVPLGIVDLLAIHAMVSGGRHHRGVIQNTTSWRSEPRARELRWPISRLASSITSLRGPGNTATVCSGVALAGIENCPLPTRIVYPERANPDATCVRQRDLVLSGKAGAYTIRGVVLLCLCRCCNRKDDAHR
jgi:hypothetical protein